MDYMIRATAANAAIRAFAAVTTEMVQEAQTYHGTSPVASAALGRSLTAGVMMGSMLKGEKDLISLLIRGDGPLGGVTVTADSQGHAKGYVYDPSVYIPAKPNGKLDVSGSIGRGTLQIIKDMGLKEPYSGTVNLISGEIAEDITEYFVVSEQVPSAVGLGVLVNPDETIRTAGGFIIQLMPFTPEETIAALEQRLSKVQSVTAMLSTGMTPEDILNALLDGFEPEFTDRQEVSYLCDCSRERFERGLISLGRKELQDMIDDGESIEIACQFCGKKYNYSVDELRDILKRAVRE